MFTFKVRGIQFDAKLSESILFRDKHDRTERKEWREERAREYKSGNAVGYEIVCSDGSFKIHALGDQLTGLNHPIIDTSVHQPPTTICS